MLRVGVSEWRLVSKFHSLETLGVKFDDSYSPVELDAACRTLEEMDPEGLVLEIAGTNLTPQHLDEMRSLSIIILDLSASRLSGDDLSSLSKYQQLIELILGADQLTSESIKHLSRIPLSILTLRGRRVGDNELIRLGTATQALGTMTQTWIRLEETNVTDVGLRKVRTIFRHITR